MSVREVVKEVSTLSRVEQDKVWQALNEIINPEPIELRLQRALFAEGLLSEIKLPVRRHSPNTEIPPIKIKGQPISETIIEERR